MPFCSQLIREQRSKSCFPVANRLMRKRETTFEKHFCEIAQTQFVAQSPENHEQNNVCGEVEGVKGGACSFVEKMFALRAEKCCIAEFGFLGSLLGSGCSTMGTAHWFLLLMRSGCSFSMSIPER